MSLKKVINHDLNTSSIELDSDFSLFNSEMNGGQFKHDRDSSDFYTDTSSVNIDSDYNLSDSDMIGGNISLAMGYILGRGLVNDIFKSALENNLKKIKDIIELTLKVLANMIKLIKDKNFYTEFDTEKKFWDSYHRTMGEYLKYQSLSQLTNKQKLVNILNLNTIAIIDVKELIEKNDSRILKHTNISTLIEELKNSISKF